MPNFLTAPESWPRRRAKFRNGHCWDKLYGSEKVGAYDEVGVWNRALSDAEVAELYNNGTGTSPGGTLSPAATPTFSPNGGSITNTTPITVTCTNSNATIAYWVDSGSTQTCSAPLTLPVGTHTLRAYATAPGCSQSLTATSLPYQVSALTPEETVWTGLQAGYKFEGNCQDVLGGAPLLINGSASFGPGKSGAAVNLAPVAGNNFLSRNPFDFSGGYTYCGWVKPTTAASGTLLCSAGYGGTTLRCANGQVSLWHYRGDGGPGWFGFTYSDITLQPGRWSFVCARWSGAAGTLSLNVNGVKTEQTGVVGYYADSQNYPYLFRVGFEGWGGSEQAGTYDEVAVWNRALNDAEVAVIYGAGPSLKVFTPLKP